MRDISEKQLEVLNKSIKLLGDELADLIKNCSITDPEVVKKSREIDKLITKYHEILKELEME